MTGTNIQKRNIINLIPLVIIGLGLIILGLVSFQVISADESTDDFSVVPSQVNFPAPDLTLNDLNGTNTSIADYKNQVVLINNWATWCPPCRAEMPTLLSYYEKYHDYGFTVVGINAGDPAESVEQFVKEYRLTFPVLLDPNNKSLIAFHNDGLPSSYVIDRDGTIVLAWTGPISSKMLEKFVTPLLEQ